MSIPLCDYAAIKDRYCICYFGLCNEYVLQLIHLRPYIEKELPGISLYIACSDGLPYLSQYQRIVSKSQMQELRRKFAHIRTLECNLLSHPVLDLLQESNLPVPRFNPPHRTDGIKLSIYPNAYAPTRSLPEETVKTLAERYSRSGYEVSVDKGLEDANWVIGVENEQLFSAAFQGIRTSLIPTGVGKELYTQLFNGEILEV